MVTAVNGKVTAGEFLGACFDLAGNLDTGTMPGTLQESQALADVLRAGMGIITDVTNENAALRRKLVTMKSGLSGSNGVTPMVHRQDEPQPRPNLVFQKPDIGLKGKAPEHVPVTDSAKHDLPKPEKTVKEKTILQEEIPNKKPEAPVTHFSAPEVAPSEFLTEPAAAAQIEDDESKESLFVEKKEKDSRYPFSGNPGLTIETDDVDDMGDRSTRGMLYQYENQDKALAVQQAALEAGRLGFPMDDTPMQGNAIFLSKEVWDALIDIPDLRQVGVLHALGGKISILEKGFQVSPSADWKGDEKEVVAAFLYCCDVAKNAA